MGSTPVLRRGLHHVRYYPNSSAKTDIPALPIRANKRRTALQQNSSGIPTYVPGHNPRRTAAILNHIHATNVGAGLYRERKAYRIIFLRNATAIPFIAGDQPVINMLNLEVTNDLELYYPLSPRLAMVFTKDAVKFPDRIRSVTSFEVERYNYAIYSKSDDQIYSNDAIYLRSLVSMGKDLPESATEALVRVCIWHVADMPLCLP
jgi:hypothetical protein